MVLEDYKNKHRINYLFLLTYNSEAFVFSLKFINSISNNTFLMCSTTTFAMQVFVNLLKNKKLDSFT